MKENAVYEKSLAFAVRIVNLYKYLRFEKKEYVMSDQILRCGTSIGANLAEADYAMTQKDFLSKTYISLKECSETGYWLTLLLRTGYIKQKEYDSLNSERIEIHKLLTAITKSVKTKVTIDK